MIYNLKDWKLMLVCTSLECFFLLSKKDKFKMEPSTQAENVSTMSSQKC